MTRNIVLATTDPSAATGMLGRLQNMGYMTFVAETVPEAVRLVVTQSAWLLIVEWRLYIEPTEPEPSAPDAEGWVLLYKLLKEQ